LQHLNLELGAYLLRHGRPQANRVRSRIDAANIALLEELPGWQNIEAAAPRNFQLIAFRLNGFESLSARHGKLAALREQVPVGSKP
jgi:hypothetical protein